MGEKSAPARITRIAAAIAPEAAGMSERRTAQTVLAQTVLAESVPAKPVAAQAFSPEATAGSERTTPLAPVIAGTSSILPVRMIEEMEEGHDATLFRYDGYFDISKTARKQALFR